MKQDLIIFPFNGNAIEALDCVDEETYNIIGFVDDTLEKIGTSYCGIKVFDRKLFENFKNAKVLAVPGSYKNYKNKQKIIDSLQLDKNRFAKVIHPKAFISKNSKIGYNTIIMAGVVVTSNAEIGNHCCILPNTVIHHDSKLGDYSIVAGGVVIAGCTTIEENVYMGAGSRIKDNLVIGKGSLIGMGSNVIKNVNVDSVVFGNPARKI